MYKIDISTDLFKVKEPIVEEKFSSAKDVVAQFKDIEKLDREAVFTLTINQSNHIIDKHLISLGSVSNCIIHPREIFKSAIIDSASSIIVVHNHPGDTINPSKEDIAITEKIKKAGDIIGIKLLDHIIIGRDKYYSFSDEGKL